jgi:hypothetical protein
VIWFVRTAPTPELKNIPVSLLKAGIMVVFQRTIFKARKVLSAIHLGLFFGLITYAFVNLVDILEGFIPGLELVYGGKDLAFSFLPAGAINAFNLIADLMSGALLIAITVFLLSRFIAKDKRLSFRENVLLNPKVKAGGQNTDSLIVGVFVILHVTARFGQHSSYGWRIRSCRLPVSSTVSSAHPRLACMLHGGSA